MSAREIAVAVLELEAIAAGLRENAAACLAEAPEDDEDAADDAELMTDDADDVATLAALLATESPRLAAVFNDLSTDVRERVLTFAPGAYALIEAAR